MTTRLHRLTLSVIINGYRMGNSIDTYWSAMMKIRLRVVDIYIHWFRLKKVIQE